MKNIIVLALMFAGALTGKILAQSADANKEKMKIFSEWVGTWKGEGSMQMGAGEPKKSSVEEHIETRLENTLIVIEGTGKAVDPDTHTETVVHHAFAVLSYDPASGQYKFKTYLKDGKNADAWFNVTGENTWQWGFDTPKGKIRYNIIVNPVNKTWNEKGEFSSDGISWMNFFEMNLTKV
jgi:hypothetical protein